MKKFTPLFVFCLILAGIPLNAQWANLGNGISQTNRIIASLSIVDEDVIWGLTWSNPGFYPTFEFARTTDGGDTWTPGLIDADSVY